MHKPSDIKSRSPSIQIALLFQVRNWDSHTRAKPPWLLQKHKYWWTRTQHPSKDILRGIWTIYYVKKSFNCPRNIDEVAAFLPDTFLRLWINIKFSICFFLIKILIIVSIQKVLFTSTESSFSQIKICFLFADAFWNAWLISS